MFQTISQIQAQGALHPISHAQRFFIDLHHDPEVLPAFNDYLTVRWAFRMIPGVRPRVVSQAFNKLVARHDSLRLGFVQTGSDWRCRILPTHPTGLIVKDFGEMDPEAEARVIAQIAAQSMSVMSECLFEVHLLKFGKCGDVVLVRVHHAVIDGYGIALLIEDFLKLALGMPLSGPVVTHQQFIEARRGAITENAIRNDAFWSANLAETPWELPIGRKAKGLPALSPRTLTTTGRRDGIFDPCLMRRLTQRSKQQNISLFSYLHAVFAETLCEFSGQDAMRVSSVAGRRDLALTNFVGADFSPFVIAYKYHGGALDDAARTSARLVQQAVEHLPHASFAAGSRVGDMSLSDPTAFPRFHIHIPMPLGRIKNSPFKKLFTSALQGKVSLGPISCERVQFPITIDTVHELELSLTPMAGEMNASLFYDSEAFDADDIATIVAQLSEKCARVLD